MGYLQYLQGCGGGWTHESACCSAGPHPVDDQVRLITVYCVVLCGTMWYCVGTLWYSVYTVKQNFRFFSVLYLVLFTGYSVFGLFGMLEQAVYRVLTSFLCLQNDLQTTFKQPINVLRGDQSYICPGGTWGKKDFRGYDWFSEGNPDFTANGTSPHLSV